MAEFNEETVKNLSMLSRIGCSDEELETLYHDLQKILDYADQLMEVDTSDIPPCNQVLKEMSNVMRNDEMGEVMPRSEFLENAPDQIGGLIRVPPVIKNKG